MATTPNGKIVLVTGINGYIASVTGLYLLQKGYTLRGTSRAISSSEPLLRGSYKEFESSIQLVEVRDMTQPGAFDEAVRGVSAIIHAASPVNWSLSDPDKVIGPAVDGALGILESAVKHAGTQLESFVFVSSGAAIIEPKSDPEYVFTEKDWNNYAEEMVKQLGKEAPGQLVYNASKAAAEKAVWKFEQQRKAKFSISSVNPSTLIGPSPQVFPKGFQPNVSLEYIWGIFSGTFDKVPPKLGSGSFADVRDVAKLQIWALENPERSSGERYLAANGPGFPQAAADILHRAYPERAEIMPKGKPGEGYPPDYSWPSGALSVSGEKGQKAMGEQWIGFEQSVLDTARWLKTFC